MSNTTFRLVPLEATHDRGHLNCGSEPLDTYLRQQVSQDIRRRVTACFVALTDEQRIDLVQATDIPDPFDPMG